MPIKPFNLRLRHCGLVALALLVVLGQGAEAADSLSARIDQLVAAKASSTKQSLAPAADDAEFLRRVYLDFAGSIPDAEEARKFLADASPDKRVKLVDRLMAEPRFAEQMAEVFNVQLMERNGDNEEWRRYLVEAFRANKPWDQMAREILGPDFKDEKVRGAGYFITRRLEKVGQQETDYPGVTRDAGRLFMGVDLQCCQCHKHLTVKDYKQIDFNGMFVAFQNTKLQEPAGEYRTKWLQEGLLTNKYEFVSVLSSAKGATGPRVPLGVEVPLPDPARDELWLVPPDRKTRVAGVPKFSPLRALAQHIASPENPLFARNIANRVWWQFMGRGLVEPLDLNHGDNPPSHPELLELLAGELTAHKFDLRWLVRELARTQTYQRSSRLPAGGKSPPEELFTVALERPLVAEQLARAFLSAVGEHGRVVGGKGWEGIEGKKYTQRDFEKAFVSAFANAAKEPELSVNPTLRAALFLRNNELVLWAIQRRKGNLMDRVAGLPDAGQVADELYHTILSRPPVAEERAEVAAYLAKHSDVREKALGHYAWAMLSSMEFFTNH